MVVSLVHTVRCLDFAGYWFLPLDTVHTVATAICVAGPLHVVFLLVTSWITIIDGGKSKKTPPWAKLLSDLAKVTSYTAEVGILKCLMPLSFTTAEF